MAQATLYKQHVVSIEDLSLAQIHLILDTAQALKQKPQADVLKKQIMASCFFEPSTRTKLSFESAMFRLGGQVIGFSDPGSTSAKKGESLQDSIRVIASYADALVIRHPAEGSARLAAEVSAVPVINAGDGANQHPTQTLLDLFTIKECQGQLDELHIALVGDLKYGRTVHSLAKAYRHFPKVRFYFIAPELLAMPDSVCASLRDAGIRFSFHKEIEEVLNKLDVLYMTRLQQERFAVGEYERVKDTFRLTNDMLQQAKSNLRIMHPLPRLGEIATAVDSSAHAYYFQQAQNGLYVRQAILSLILEQ